MDTPDFADDDLMFWLEESNEMAEVLEGFDEASDPTREVQVVSAEDERSAGRHVLTQLNRLPHFQQQRCVQVLFA